MDSNTGNGRYPRSILSKVEAITNLLYLVKSTVREDPQASLRYAEMAEEQVKALAYDLRPR
jgi:hypothetical protein